MQGFAALEAFVIPERDCDPVKFVPLKPIRSTFPSSRRRSGGAPTSNNANRMLDEPPFIVRRAYELLASNMFGLCGQIHWAC